VVKPHLSICRFYVLDRKKPLSLLTRVQTEFSIKAAQPKKESSGDKNIHHSYYVNKGGDYLILREKD